MSLRGDIDQAIRAVLAPLVTAGQVAHVQPWAGEEEPQPDDEETTRVTTGSYPAILVSLPSNTPQGTVKNAQKERHQVRVTIVMRMTDQVQLLYGIPATPQLGVYDLIELVRTALDNLPIALPSGEQFSLVFTGDSRIDQFSGQLSWQLSYYADFRSDYNPVRGAELLELVQSRVNQLGHPDNPVIAFDTELP